jgi:hypothetical protein
MDGRVAHTNTVHHGGRGGFFSPAAFGEVDPITFSEDLRQTDVDMNLRPLTV